MPSEGLKGGMPISQDERKKQAIDSWNERTKDLPDMLPVAQVAELIGVSERQVYQFIASKQLESESIRRVQMVSRGSVGKLLANQKIILL